MSYGNTMACFKILGIYQDLNNNCRMKKFIIHADLNYYSKH